MDIQCYYKLTGTHGLIS